LGDLFGSVLYGLINVHTHPPNCISPVSDRPRANALAAFPAASGHVVVNAHHQVHTLDALSSEVRRLANGERPVSAIVHALCERSERGAIALQGDGKPAKALDVARTINRRPGRESAGNPGAQPRVGGLVPRGGIRNT
jgi:hypothetical protein